MALILSIETATSNCSVALRNDGHLVGIKQRNEANIHASKLFVFIDALMKETGYGYKDLTAIAVSKGPGSYTGLRIGVSAAKGLCYSLSIPLLSVNTLHVMVNEASREPLKGNALLIPMLDARRMEVYCSVFNQTQEEINPTKACIIDSGSFSKELEQACYFFGDGMPKCRTILASHPNAFFIDDIVPGADSLSLLAYAKFLKGKFEDTAYFEPFYLKEFVTQSTFHKK